MGDMRFRRRITAGILAAVLAVGAISPQAGIVRAKEAVPQTAVSSGTEAGVGGSASADSEVSSDQEPGSSNGGTEGAESGDAADGITGSEPGMDNGGSADSEPGDDSDGTAGDEPGVDNGGTTDSEPGDDADGTAGDEPDVDNGGSADSEPGDDADGTEGDEPGVDNGGTADSEPGDDADGTEGSEPGTDDETSEDNGLTEDELLIEEADEKADGAQISGNDLIVPEEEEKVCVAEAENAYQFGGAPSEGGGLSVFAVSFDYDAASQYLYEQIMKRSEEIDISAYGLNAESLRSLVSGVLNDHPDLYFVDQKYSYYSGSAGITKVVFTYRDDFDDAAFQSAVAAALGAVDSGAGDLEKAIVLHDYLAVNCEYDYENYLNESIPADSYTAYGTLVKHTAVCQGYALTYKYLLNQMGIECYMVTSAKMNHAWNLIKLDGSYYQVDVTWDDPTWDMVGRVIHTNMLCSDAAFEDPKGHHDWQVTSGNEVVNYTATDTRYDSAFWKDSNSPLVMMGGDCYYISYSGRSLKKTNLADVENRGTTVRNIATWYSWDGNSIWQGTYSGLFGVDGRLYYNDARLIYSIAPDGTDVRSEFRADTTDGYIYGSAYCRGKVLYSLRQTPNLEGKETVLTAVLSGGVGEPDVPEEPDDPEQSESALNLKNLSQEYTTTADGKISSTAAGRPKLLIFYSNGCGNSRMTINHISQNIGDYTGVDIYAIENNSGTKESVIEFQKTYGCGEITFSYDADGRNAARMWEYADAAGLGNRVTWPVICYIDANDRLQYVTTGYQMSNAVLDYLKKYCGFTEDSSNIDLTAANVSLKNSVFTYNGEEHKPKAVVTAFGRVLVEGQDYTLSYRDNRNAGTATVTVEGINQNHGSTSRTYEIKPANVVIRAKDMSILIGDSIPTEYAYEVSGLVAGESLSKAPSFSCPVTSTAAAGQYDIIPAGADAGANYTITYEKGTLSVASEYVACTVTFDVCGHGTAPAKIYGIKAGSTIARPQDPVAAGCRFDGWYTDTACTKVWKFDTDIVQKDITLYAKWLVEGTDSEFALQEIADVYYTGKACKPAVSVYDGRTLLKAGRDYQIKYYNNINVNKDGVLKNGDGTGERFREDLPYVEITGKGDYAEVVKVNFNILKASIGDGSDKPAPGVTLKVSDQLVTANKAVKPFSSIKYVKGMRRDVDFTLSLTVVNARNQSGVEEEKGRELDNAEIPAGYEGAFELTIRGTGNYEGSIRRTIHVADKTHLIKNAKITLGKNLKNIIFDGSAVELTPAQENSDDTFTVKCGDVFLKYNTDYKVHYNYNDRVGKAELVVTGINEYAGSKTVNFNIKGRPLTAKMVQVDGLTDQVYTGRALTQNGVRLTYGIGTEEETVLKYGRDYTISYTKNIDKGTATMLFQAAAQSGYSGNFKKTFKITAADIDKVTKAEGMQDITAVYSKQGAKPAEEIVLTNDAGMTLQNGKDYTLKYTNNKAAAEKTGENPPTVTVKGKGNYEGTFDVPFRIVRCDLGGSSIEIKTTPVAYQVNKTAEYAYKPAVKVMDGKAALRAGTDYEITYVNNTQSAYEKYMETPAGAGSTGTTLTQAETNNLAPIAVITEKEGSSYSLDGEMIVPLPIYKNKLTKSNLEVKQKDAGNTEAQIYIGEQVYTGEQITPEITVRYTDENGSVLLREGVDYTVSYGANIKSGKNKGSVKISGMSPHYGGDVTVKFNIGRKTITY